MHSSGNRDATLGGFGGCSAATASGAAVITIASKDGGRALLIVNRKARSGDESAEAARAALEAAGLRVSAFVPPAGACPAPRRSWPATASGAVDRVVLGGGDGTLNAAIPGLLQAGLPLGILPLGTANDLARSLGIPLELEAAAQVIAGGSRRARWTSARSTATRSSMSPASASAPSWPAS